jgi:hypothetical protein
LELHGPLFNDTLLSSGLEFPALEILELRATGVNGVGLGALAALPSLRVLRLSCGVVTDFHLERLPVSGALEIAAFENLPAMLYGAPRLEVAFPNIKELSMSSASEVVSDAAMALPRLERLALEFPSMPQWVRVGEGTMWLSLHLKNATDSQIADLLAAASNQLDAVELRGTPVTDAIFGPLARCPNLSYLDLCNTRVTPEALHVFAVERPGLKYYPRQREPQ